LRAASRQSVHFLKSHLRPIPAVEAKRLAQLIADLDDARFAVREKASTKLAKYGARAEPDLRETLQVRCRADFCNRTRSRFKNDPQIPFLTQSQANSIASRNFLFANHLRFSPDFCLSFPENCPVFRSIAY
jgi:hypothetical protein